MSAPPLRPHPPRADHSRDTDLSRSTIDYADPTGNTAIRNLLNGGGPYTITAENGFRLFVNRESLEHMLTRMRARVSRGGKLWLDPAPPVNKNNPDAVAKFGDSDSTGVHTETPNY